MSFYHKSTLLFTTKCRGKIILLHRVYAQVYFPVFPTTSELGLFYPKSCYSAWWISKYTNLKLNTTGLAKKFIRVFPYDVMEKPERTLWPTQLFPKESVLQSVLKTWPLLRVYCQRQGHLNSPHWSVGLTSYKSILYTVSKVILL